MQVLKITSLGVPGRPRTIRELARLVGMSSGTLCWLCDAPAMALILEDGAQVPYCALHIPDPEIGGFAKPTDETMGQAASGLEKKDSIRRQVPPGDVCFGPGTTLPL
jgi:hypothetical protein